MPTVVNSYRLPDGVTVFEYDDGSKAYVHYLIPVDEAGNVITGGGGGTGGAATIADGADIAEGSKADTAATDTTGPWTVVSLLKGLLAAVKGTLAVTGTFWQATQPVSGTFWQAKQPVSLADGDDATQGVQADAASTATDATPITGMSVWKQISKSVQAIATSVAGTLTATISGTVTANAGTNLNTSSLALEAGGNLASSKADLDTLAGTVASSRVRVDRTDRNVTGNLTSASGAGSTVAIDTTGMSTCYFSYSGTFSGLIIIEGFDGTAWVTNSGYILQSTEFTTSYAGLKNTFNSGNNKSSSAVFPCAGFQQIRARCTSWTSGSAAVILNAAAGEGPWFPKTLVGYSGNVLQIGGLGEIYVAQKGVAPVGGRSTTNAFVDNPSDGETGTGLLAVGPMGWDGSAWQKKRTNDNAVTILASAARTATIRSALFPMYNARGLLILLGITAGTSPNLSMAVLMGNNFQYVRPAETAVTTLATHGYVYYPGVSEAEVQTADFITKQYRSVAIGGAFSIEIQHFNSNSITYSVSVIPID